VTGADRVEPEFVEEIPRQLEPGKLYISMEFGTAVHLCCCGCCSEVVTPLHPTRWTLLYDGQGVSLHPSIGSWSLPCQSHYFIVNNRVRWAPRWSTEDVEEAQARDRADTVAFFSSETATLDEDSVEIHPAARREGALARLWRRLTGG
jgi:hypothetical protein